MCGLLILHSINHYLSNRASDMKKRKPPRTAFRLRSGDYRVFFDLADDNAIHITGVRIRREAYRRTFRLSPENQRVRLLQSERGGDHYRASPAVVKLLSDQHWPCAYRGTTVELSFMI